MAKNLVIVESPAKAKTINRYLGKDYTVLSSYGHVRDLPKSKMGIDTTGDFSIDYAITDRAKKVIAAIKAKAKGAETIYFATDEDREGEAIAWHLLDVLKTPAESAKRITFSEITKTAITNAVAHPRTIDINLVDAQQARRVLDRLVGYELSPFLWKKIRFGLSAGRVQSVAVRLIIEREREIEKFNKEEYWTIEAELSFEGQTIVSRLVKIADKSLGKMDISAARAKEIEQMLKTATWTVASIQVKDTKKNPNAPYTTSTLQQDANNKLGFSAKQTMRLAQQLYEGVELGDEGSTGLITYMRTDSTNLSNEAITIMREVIEKDFGKEFLTDQPRVYTKKSKGAQEAHEAIRPAHPELRPKDVETYLDSQQLRLYTLIWNRALASQMPDAQLKSKSVDIAAKPKQGDDHTFRANGTTITFPGFLRVLPDSANENLLPDLKEGTQFEDAKVLPKQHFTEPPARYTEASLVKALEENGIGRPSTYAPTISTIVERGYIAKEGRSLIPKDIAFTVNDMLVEHFPEIVDVTFTAKMEEDLDRIANGEEKWVPVIKAFYNPFKEHLTEKNKTVKKYEKMTDIKCDVCGKPMVEKFGRFGKFLACSGYPECKNTKPLGEEAKLKEQYRDIKCELCGGMMTVKTGRFGSFLGCENYPKCKNIKKIEKSTGVTCPKCGKGDIIEKKSKRGRAFYGCNRYPDCDFSLWQKPTGEKCPKTSDLLVFAAKGKIKCSNKECDYEKEQTE